MDFHDFATKYIACTTAPHFQNLTGCQSLSSPGTPPGTCFWRWHQYPLLWFTAEQCRYVTHHENVTCSPVPLQHMHSRKKNIKKNWHFADFHAFAKKYIACTTAPHIQSEELYWLPATVFPWHTPRNLFLTLASMSPVVVFRRTLSLRNASWKFHL